MTNGTITLGGGALDTALAAKTAAEQRAAAQREAEAALRDAKWRLRTAADRREELTARLTSGEPGDLSGDDVALLADCIAAVGLQLTLDDLLELDPYPSVGWWDLSGDGGKIAAFGERDLPRLHKLVTEARS